MSRRTIAALFAERDRAAARLARVERILARAGRSYSHRNGYRVTLRPEALRREVGA